MNDIQPPQLPYPDLMLRQAQFALANGYRPIRRNVMQLRVWKWLAADAKGRSRDPDLQKVMAIHDQDGMQKSELQARLLTGAAFDQIAAKMDLPVSVVQLFHDVLFAVTPHLTSPSWIWMYAFQADPHHPDPIDEPSIWREVGHENPAALELLITDNRHQTSPAEHAAAERIRLLIRLRNMPLSHPDYLPLHRQLRDDIVAQAIEAPSVMLAEALKYLDILELAAREAVSRAKSLRRFQKIVDMGNRFRNLKKRSGEQLVTQEAGHGLGTQGRTTLPISDLSGSNREIPTPIPGERVRGSDAGDTLERAATGASLPPGTG